MIFERVALKDISKQMAEAGNLWAATDMCSIMCLIWGVAFKTVVISETLSG
jgi:hypothetical protein